MKPLQLPAMLGTRLTTAAGAGFGAGDGLAVSGEVFGYGLQGGHGMSFRWAVSPKYGLGGDLLYSGLQRVGERSSENRNPILRPLQIPKIP